MPKKANGVLTTTRRNIVRFDSDTSTNTGTAAILNNILLDDMQEKPSLISNIIQYSPASLALNMLEGTNVEKRDFLFGPRNRKM